MSNAAVAHELALCAALATAPITWGNDHHGIDYHGPDAAMKTKERYIFLECTACKNRNYTTFKRQKSGYKLEKKKYCPFCRKHVSHKEHKL